MTTVDYFLSTSSPWTYLGSKRFTDMAAKAGATVNVYPVAFHEVFAVSGGLPLPKRSPQRQAYRLQELSRWKRRTGLPLIEQPTNFPSTDPISARMIVAARLAGQDALALSNAILAALWEDDRNIDDADVLASIADGIGLDGKALIEAAMTDAVGAQYEEDTKMAIDKGIFGAPSYLIEGELFWGQDRVDFVAEKLGVT